MVQRPWPGPMTPGTLLLPVTCNLRHATWPVPVFIARRRRAMTTSVAPATSSSSPRANSGLVLLPVRARALAAGRLNCSPSTVAPAVVEVVGATVLVVGAVVVVPGRVVVVCGWVVVVCGCVVVVCGFVVV